MPQYLGPPFSTTHILLGAGALYLAYQSIRCHLKASSSCQEQDELSRLIKKLDCPNKGDRAESLIEISILLESRSPVSACLSPEQISAISASLLDHEAVVRAKCCHALQCILRCGNNIGQDDVIVKETVLQYTPLLLTMLSNSETVEEQSACLRLLVSLSSHRECHADLSRSLPHYWSLLHSHHIRYSTVMLVTRLLFKLSENRDLLETLLNCRVVPGFLSLLHPSNPRDTLLHCLGLLSNLSCREPPSGALGQQYNEASLHALLYAWPTPLWEALRPLTQHTDQRVKATAGYMLSRLPLPTSPRKNQARVWHDRLEEIWTSSFSEADDAE